MNNKLLTEFFFFLLRDFLSAGRIAVCVQNAELCNKSTGNSVDTDVTSSMLKLAQSFTDRFVVSKQ